MARHADQSLPSRKRGAKGAAGRGPGAGAANGKDAVAAATPKRPAAKPPISLDSEDEDDNAIDLVSPQVRGDLPVECMHAGVAACWVRCCG